MNEDRYRLRVEVSISDNYGGPGLRIQEDVTINGMDFDGMSALLKGFHELTQSIRALKSEATS